MHSKLFKWKRRHKPKNAIMIGLNYPNTRYKLFGCINDVRNGKKFFRKHKYIVKLLIDKDVTRSFNLLQALDQLALSNSNKVAFHYSGHGTQTRDFNNDEADRLDEAILSTNNTLITDDQIKGRLQKFRGKDLFLVFDCCHSGTIVDLPIDANEVGYKRINNNQFNSNIICISGCKSNQTSADVTENDISYGALSKTLYKLLRKNTSMTWRNLWIVLKKEMKEAGYAQIPQLSVSKPELLDRFISF